MLPYLETLPQWLENITVIILLLLVIVIVVTTVYFSYRIIKKIKDIKATYLLDLNKDGKWDVVEETDNDIVTDTAILNRRSYGNFCLQLEVYDTTILQTLSNKLFDYMGNNKRVKEMNEIRIKQQKELLPAITQEIIDLDSVKKVEYFENNKVSKEKSGNLLIMNEKERKLYHTDILALIQKKQNLERDLFLYPNPFEIIQDFSAPRTEENSFFMILLKMEEL